MAKKSAKAVESTAAPTWEDMELKRQEMLKSLQATAAAMQLCSTLMTDFANMSSSMKIPSAAPASAVDAPAETNGKRKRKDKVARDPLKPKRPMSAYLLYQADLRKKLLEANPGMPNNAIMGMVAEKWRALTDEEKKPYNDEYEKIHADWQAATDAYNDTLPEAQQTKAMKKRKADNVAAAAAAPAADTGATDTESSDESAAEKAAAPAAAATESATGSSSESSSESESESGAESDTESEDTVSAAAPPPPTKKVKTTKAAPVVAMAPVLAPVISPVAAPAGTPVGKATTKKSKKDAAAPSTPVAAPAKGKKAKKGDKA